jgi:hypothetical protein
MDLYGLRARHASFPGNFIPDSSRATPLLYLLCFPALLSTV